MVRRLFGSQQSLRLTFGTFALLATVGAPICASAAPLSETLTVSPFSSTSLSAPADFETNAFNQFNPSLGTLTGISATISGSAVWNVTALGVSPISDSLTVTFLTGNNPFQSQTTVSTGPVTVAVNLTDPSFSNFAPYEGTGTTNLLVEFADNIGENTISSTGGLSGSITYTYTPATPLPAALPLFATGIGGLGLLGWRRKRKVRAGA